MAFHKGKVRSQAELLPSKPSEASDPSKDVRVSFLIMLCDIFVETSFFTDIICRFSVAGVSPRQEARCCKSSGAGAAAFKSTLPKYGLSK